MNPTRTPPAVPLALEEAIVQWLGRFQREQWSGSLTLHFNKGTIQSYEPKPTLRIVS